MSGLKHAIRMSAAEFLSWQTEQPQLHELVDDVPVAMAGAKQRHDTIVVNAIVELGAQLRGGPCRPRTDDIAIPIPNGNVRRPDVSVQCEPFDDDATYAMPLVVMEVLSPSTRALDLLVKMEEYKSVASIEQIVLIDPDAPKVVAWSRREGNAWDLLNVVDPDATIDLPIPGITLSLRGLYDRVTFGPRPKPVE